MDYPVYKEKTNNVWLVNLYLHFSQQCCVPQLQLFPLFPLQILYFVIHGWHSFQEFNNHFLQIPTVIIFFFFFLFLLLPVPLPPPHPPFLQAIDTQNIKFRYWVTCMFLPQMFCTGVLEWPCQKKQHHINKLMKFLGEL